jgi:hypothetical protein
LKTVHTVATCGQNLSNFKTSNSLYTTLTQDELRYLWLCGDTEGVNRYGLNKRNVFYSHFIENKDEKIIKISFRSQVFDVNQFAKRLFSMMEDILYRWGNLEVSMEEQVPSWDLLYRAAVHNTCEIWSNIMLLYFLWFPVTNSIQEADCLTGVSWHQVEKNKN